MEDAVWGLDVIRADPRPRPRDGHASPVGATNAAQQRLSLRDCSGTRRCETARHEPWLVCTPDPSERLPAQQCRDLSLFVVQHTIPCARLGSLSAAVASTSFAKQFPKGRSVNRLHHSF